MTRSVLRESLRLLTLSALAMGGLGAQPQASPVPTGFTPVDPVEQVKAMRRGVNIIGYDPLWTSFERARFKERHFQRIHEGGFQTVRVNLQAFRHMDSSNKLDPVWFQTLDWVVKNGLSSGLQVILDEHDYGMCGNNLVACKPRLLAFWEQVAEHYKNAPAAVTFELLNEPNGQLNDETWNGLLKETLAVVRKTNPRRNVIIGPASWNNIHHLDKLELPAADRNIIVTVHYYLPMEFTHQGAAWNQATAKLSGVKWGTAEEQHSVEQDFAGVQQWSQKEKRPILLGEFGAYDKGDMDSRVRYTSFVARTAERLGWAWSYWQFDSDFLVWDMAKDEWVQPIWKALVP